MSNAQLIAVIRQAATAALNHAADNFGARSDICAFARLRGVCYPSAAVGMLMRGPLNAVAENVGLYHLAISSCLPNTMPQRQTTRKR